MRSLARRSVFVATLVGVLLGAVGIAAPVAGAAPPITTRVEGINVDATTIPQLERLMNRHRLSSVALVEFSPHRINRLTPSPPAIIPVSKRAMADARHADVLRRQGDRR